MQKSSTFDNRNRYLRESDKKRSHRQTKGILEFEEGGGTRMLSSPHQNDRDICTNGKGACEIHRISYKSWTPTRKKCLIMYHP